MTPDEIRTARALQHRARARDFADAHGISEAALVAAFTGPDCVRIDAAPDRLMPLLMGLGQALALTRNDSAVQERQGRYVSYEPGDETAVVRGPEIELRLAPAHWVHAFAVTEPTAKETKRSIQVFDAAGDAVHKIHLTEDSNVEAFERLTGALLLPMQPDSLRLAPRAAPRGVTGDPARLAELQAGWEAQPDEAAFRRFLGNLGMSTLFALRGAGAPRTRRLAPEAVTELLERASAGKVELVIRSGNPGCQQVYSGPVERILPAGYWINVMDPRFNLHLRTDHLAEVWLVDRPGRGGRAVSVEAFDAGGEAILHVSGRHPGADWTALAAGLTSDAEA